MFASAILRPQTCYFGHELYPTVFLKAAAMLEALARYHTLFEGNKRTAFILAGAFLFANDYVLPPYALFGVDDFMVAVVEERLGIEDIALYLELFADAVEE